MPNVLSDIVKNKREEIEAEKGSVSIQSLQEMAVAGKQNFCEKLNRDAINLITEIKPKSPSAGQLRTQLNLPDVIAAYDEHAAAISVLTDNKYFGGSFDLLKSVSQSTDLPTLCKDFILEPYQCFKARVSGAQAVLLIVKILDDEMLLNLQELIISLHMTPVVEVQNESELTRALNAKSKVILINNRNLDTLVVDLDETRRLAPMIPADVVKISASGVETRADLEKLTPYCKNFLIGSSLMRSNDIAKTIKELKGVVTTSDPFKASR